MIKLQGDVKKLLGIIEGKYSLQPKLFNMHPYWTNKSKTCSIWFVNGYWKVGYNLSYLGRSGELVKGPYGEEDWPQNISSGWKYFAATTWLDAGSNVTFEARSTGKLSKVQHIINCLFIHQNHFHFSK